MIEGQKDLHKHKTRHTGCIIWFLKYSTQPYPAIQAESFQLYYPHFKTVFESKADQSDGDTV